MPRCCLLNVMWRRLMKNKIKLTGVELNCIEIAVQHHIDELEDALADTGTGWKSAYKKDECLFDEDGNNAWDTLKEAEEVREASNEK